MVKNLYRKKFPKRTKHQLVTDILRLNDKQWKQFQGVVGQFSGGSILHKSIRKPKRKIKPSTWETLKKVPDKQTLAALIAIERAAHDDPHSESHEGGGLWEGT